MKTLKQIFLTLSLICISLCVFAQRFVNPIGYNENTQGDSLIEYAYETSVKEVTVLSFYYGDNNYEKQKTIREAYSLNLDSFFFLKRKAKDEGTKATVQAAINISRKLTDKPSYYFIFLIYCVLIQKYGNK